MASFFLRQQQTGGEGGKGSGFYGKGTLPCRVLAATLAAAVLWPACAMAQESPKARFGKTEVKVGEPVSYILTYRHSPATEVVFPDSLYDFTPFEYLGRQSFPTRTDAQGSVDSVVYTLAIFDLKKTHSLAVPVFEIRSGQKIPVYPDKMGLSVKTLIEQLPDSAALIENHHLLLVPKQFNYPYLLAGAGALLLLATVFSLVFGKQLRRGLAVRKLRRLNNRFILQYDKLVYGGPDREALEQAVSLWKKHTGMLYGLPLASYTTKETQAVFNDSGLGTHLKSVDKALYAGMNGSDLQQSMVFLKDFAVQAYHKKVEELKHG